MTAQWKFTRDGSGSLGCRVRPHPGPPGVWARAVRRPCAHARPGAVRGRARLVSLGRPLARTARRGTGGEARAPRPAPPHALGPVSVFGNVVARGGVWNWGAPGFAPAGGWLWGSWRSPGTPNTTWGATPRFPSPRAPARSRPRPSLFYFCSSGAVRGDLGPPAPAFPVGQLWAGVSGRRPEPWAGRGVSGRTLSPPRACLAPGV